MTKKFVFCVLLLLSLPAVQAKAEAWPGNAIGSGFGVAAKPERTGRDQLEKIKAAGFSYVRYDMRWNEVEYRPGSYNWFLFDRFIRNMRKVGLKSVIILDGGTRFYKDQSNPSSEDKTSEPGSDYILPTSEDALRGYTVFAKAAVGRYGADDIIWEIWNEPDMPVFWPPKPDPVAFSLFADRTCRALREVTPQAKIIGPAVARLPSRTDFLHRQFFQTFIQSPVKDCLDAISVHPYRHDRPPETVIEDYADKVRPFIAKYTAKDRSPLPVVDSEWGYTTTDVTPKQQAAFALRLHLSDLLAGVPLSILYEWQDSAQEPDPREQHFGMVDAAGDDKEGSALLEQILPQIKDATIVRRLPVNDHACYVLLLRQPDGRFALLAWMGLMNLDRRLTLQVKNVGDKSPLPYPLSLEPQLITINSPEPLLAVTNNLAKPPS